MRSHLLLLFLLLFHPVIRFRGPNVFWVDSHQKRYVPAVGDSLIGHVFSKIGVDFFRVDIGAAQVGAGRGCARR